MTDLTNTPSEPLVDNSLLGGDQNPAPQDNNPVEPMTPPAGAPESIDGYEVNVEGFNYEDFKAIPENQEFLDRAHKAGLNNDALNFLLGEYNDLLPALMEQNQHLDNEACITAMTETWGGETSTNFGFAQAAANNAIQNGILTPEEVNSPEFGNNPLVLKMAAYFGKQLQEDAPPSNTQQSGAEDIQSLMQSEAYLNSNHPDHKRVFAQVEGFYQKQFK